MGLITERFLRTKKGRERLKENNFKEGFLASDRVTYRTDCDDPELRPPPKPPEFPSDERELRRILKKEGLMDLPIAE